MERKILITGISITVCISVLIIFVLFRGSRNNHVNPFKAIPQDASYIIKLNGFDLPKQLIDPKTKVWQELNNIPNITLLNRNIEKIDSLINIIPNLQELQVKHELFISGHLGGSNTYNYLFLFALPNGFGERDITSFLKKNKVEYSSRKFEGRSIYSVDLSKSINYFISFDKGLFLCSTNQALLEDALRQASLTVSLLDNEKFNAMVNATGKNQVANLFINLEHIGKLFSNLANDELSTICKNYKIFGEWAELDFNVNPDLFLLNGFTKRNDTESDFISLVTSGKPVPITVDQVLPAGVSGLLVYGLSDPEQSYKNFLEYLKLKGSYGNYMANLAEMNTKYGIEFEKFFLSLIDNELALAYKTDSKEPAKGTHYLVFKCLSGTDAQNELESLTNKIRMIKGGTLTYTYSPDNSLNYKIYRLPIVPLFGRLLGNYFNVLDDNYITVIDNYLIVADSYTNISSLIYDYILKKTLANDESFQSFAGNLSKKSYLLVYMNLLKVEPYFDKYLNDSLIYNWRKNQSSFQNVQIAGFQVSEVSNLPYFNFVLKYLEDFRGKPHTVWESRLDSTISFKPKFVINHNTKENEILIFILASALINHRPA